MKPFLVSEQEVFSLLILGLMLLSMKEAGQMLFRSRNRRLLIGGTFIERLLPLDFAAFRHCAGCFIPT